MPSGAFRPFASFLQFIFVTVARFKHARKLFHEDVDQLRVEVPATLFAEQVDDSLEFPGFLVHPVAAERIEHVGHRCNPSIQMDFLAFQAARVAVAVNPLVMLKGAVSGKERNVGTVAQQIEAFFRMLPRDTEQAAALARRSSDWMKDRADWSVDEHRPLRHAVEVRHESFVDPSFVELLHGHDIAWVIADTAGKWPYKEDITADFVYIRLHGETELYASGYDEASLERWAARIRAWASGGEPPDAVKIAPEASPERRDRDVYCYFDNDYKVRAPFDAQTLMRILGLSWNPESVEPTAPRRSRRGTEARAPSN